MKIFSKVYAILAIITTAATIHTANGDKYLAEKPDFLIPCHLQDPNFTQCFAKSYGVLFHEWKDGIPGLKTIGSIDPLEVKRVVIDQDPNNPVSLHADLFNVLVKGASNAIIQEMRFDPKTLKQKIKIAVPKLRFDSDYKLNGRILNLSLNGNGKAFFEVENFVIILHVQVKLRDEFGFTFTDMEKLQLEIVEVGGFSVRLDNLFNGQKVLEDSTNAVFNENWREFYDILKPAIKEAVQAIMKERLSKAYSYVPANYFIADIPTAAEHSG